MDTLLWFVLGAAAGAGGAGVVWIAYWWTRRRARSSGEPNDEPSAADSIESPRAEVVRSPLAPPVDRLADPPPPARVADLARLSERIVLQLARLGRIEPDAPVGAARTQQGLAEAAGSNQSAVSKVLRRLVAAEIIAEERRHIVGSSQRMKAYSLSRRGELLAREVARRHHVDLLPPREPPGREDGSKTRGTPRP
ncbi:MAG: hypothetical protein WB789_08590 [Thermoplasmata archaeon]